jgi:hypothetical protein
MNGHLIGTAFVILSLVGRHAAAQAAPSRQDLTDRLKPEDEATVTLADGSTRRGTVEAVSATGLTLVVDSRPLALELREVREIRKRGDSLRNGTLVGLIAGLAGSIALGSYTGALCDNEGGQNCPEIVVSGWIVPAAMGTLFGAAIDAERVGTTLVFGSSTRLSIAPFAGRHAFGLNASVALR